MNSQFLFFLEPLSFYNLTIIISLILFAEAIFKQRKPWSISAIVIYAMVGIWYLTEPIYTPKNLDQFSAEIVESAFSQVLLFLVSFRFFLTFIYSKIVRVDEDQRTMVSLTPDKILKYFFLIWLFLLGYGISRLNGDVFAALFPLGGRNAANMWSRAAASGAGSTGFIVSIAGYVYLLICSMLGALLPLQTRPYMRILNLCLILISWPFYFFMGARNQLLAVILPFVFSFALFYKTKVWIKALSVGFIGLIFNQILLIIISYRDRGFSENLSSGGFDTAGQTHAGLNMLEELCHINTFFQQGRLHLSYGGEYFTQVLNIIPRAIWPSKPLIGNEYAILRGFGGNSESDIGVFATVSHGFIGQGFVNFGPYLGPILVGILMAVWSLFLSYFWMKKDSILWQALFLFCLGLTFNLGRDITLIVLWPAIFGYTLVYFIEKLAYKQSS